MTSRSPRRTCRPHRRSAPRGRRADTRTSVATQAGRGRVVGGTRRLPVSPFVDTYLVPERTAGRAQRPLPPHGAP
eukprot:2682871-Prymnesium_polylepis.1